MTKYRSIPEPTVPITEESESEDEENSPDYEFKKWCGVRRSTVLFVFYVVSYLAYLFIGGYIMSLLETPHEEELKKRTRNLKEHFLQNYPQINSKTVLSFPMFK